MDDHVRFCPKCDSDLRKQTDGSAHTIDIAHHRETAAEAVGKLQAAIRDHRTSLTRTLRVIVGQGLIREAAAAALTSLRAERAIRSWAFEKGNPGAIVVRLKR